MGNEVVASGRKPVVTCWPAGGMGRERVGEDGLPVSRLLPGSTLEPCAACGRMVWMPPYVGPEYALVCSNECGVRYAGVEGVAS